MRSLYLFIICYRFRVPTFLAFHTKMCLTSQNSSISIFFSKPLHKQRFIIKTFWQVYHIEKLRIIAKFNINYILLLLTVSSHQPYLTNQILSFLKARPRSYHCFIFLCWKLRRMNYTYGIIPNLQMKMTLKSGKETKKKILTVKFTQHLHDNIKSINLNHSKDSSNVTKRIAVLDILQLQGDAIIHQHHTIQQVFLLYKGH